MLPPFSYIFVFLLAKTTLPCYSKFNFSIWRPIMAYNVAAQFYFCYYYFFS